MPLDQWTRTSPRPLRESLRLERQAADRLIGHAGRFTLTDALMHAQDYAQTTGKAAMVREIKHTARVARYIVVEPGNGSQPGEQWYGSAFVVNVEPASVLANTWPTRLSRSSSC